jgi:hypothetical protein
VTWLRGGGRGGGITTLMTAAADDDHHVTDFVHAALRRGALPSLKSVAAYLLNERA